MGIITEHHLLLFLIQFALILGMSKMLGLVLRKWKQSTLTADLLVGILLGSAVLGKISPSLQQSLFPPDPVQNSMLQTIAWIGNLYLLMETGLGINFSQIWKQRGPALTIAVSDIILPILLLYVPTYFLLRHVMPQAPNSGILAVFLAMLMSFTGLPVAVRVMYDLHILKSDFGFLIISALTINDLIGWISISVVLKLMEQSVFDVSMVLQSMALIFLFVLISMTIFRRSIDWLMTRIHERIGSESGIKTSFVFLMGMIFGAVSMMIGAHSLFGFFLAGIVIGSVKHFSENDRHVMNRMVHSIFVPIFFANVGLQLNFGKSFDLTLVLFFTVLGFLIRYTGAYIGAWLAKQEKFNLNPIALCHTPGGEMQIVVAGMIFAGHLISEPIFVAIVISSILSTITLGPLLSKAIDKQKESILNVLFSRDAIFPDQNFSTKIDLIDFLAEKVAQRTRLPFDSIRGEIWMREERMTTAIGQGIAFPHARLEGIHYPQIMLLRNRTGLDWDSPDGKLVHLIFLIITPTQQEKSHLQILQILARSLANQEILVFLRESNSTDEIWNRLQGNFFDLKLN